MTTTPKMAKAVDLFVGQAGYAEGRCSATVGNRTKFGQWYGMDCAAWCAMSASWAYFTAGFPQPATIPKGFAYTPSGAAWYQRQQAWSPPTANPEKGWVIFFYSNSAGRIAHVGLVRGPRGSDGLIPTVEGNTNGAGSAEGGAVLLKRRSPSQALSFRIAGYGRPDLLPNADLVKPEPEKGWWEMGIPGPELQKIQAEAVDALQSSEGKAAIKAAAKEAMWEVMNDVLTQIGSNQVLVKQTNAPQVYVLLSSRLLHVDSPAKLSAIGGSDARAKIMEYPADDPIWQLPITGQAPTPQA